MLGMCLAFIHCANSFRTGLTALFVAWRRVGFGCAFTRRASNPSGRCCGWSIVRTEGDEIGFSSLGSCHTYCMTYDCHVIQDDLNKRFQVVGFEHADRCWSSFCTHNASC